MGEEFKVVHALLARPYRSVRKLLSQIPWFIVDALGINALFRHLTRLHTRVLMYHGVSDEPMGTDYWLMLSRSRFEWQMSYLQDKFVVSPWTSLVEDPTTRRDHRSPRVVLTFDDTYANVLSNACPILRRYAYPAVCFVIPDLSAGGEEIWTTRAFRLLLESQHTLVPLGSVPPGRLELPAERLSRMVAVRRFVNGLKARSASEIKSVMDHVERYCGAEDPVRIAREFALIGIDDISRLTEEADITIGTHSNTHYSLSSMSAIDQEKQIADSIADLKRYGIEATAVFAYPSGHFNAETVAILKRHGFRLAFTTAEGFFRPGDDRLQISRVAVGGDMTKLEFKAKISGVGYGLTELRRRWTGFWSRTVLGRARTNTGSARSG